MDEVLCGARFGTGRDSFHPLRRSRILQRMLLAAAATHMNPLGKSLVLDSRHPCEDRGADPAAIELRKQQLAPLAADPNPPFHITPQKLRSLTSRSQSQSCHSLTPLPSLLRRG
jgi:hypothetical protein